MNKIIFIKKLVLSVLFLSVLPAVINAQGVLHLSPGSILTTSENSILTISNGSLSQQGLLYEDKGSLIFNGTASALDPKIEGTGTILLNNLTIDKSIVNLTLENHIKVAQSLTLNTGGIELLNGNIDLDSSGILYNEINTRRIFGLGGEIYRTADIVAFATNNPANLGAIINSGISQFKTKIIRGHKPFVVNGNDGAFRYYKIQYLNNPAPNSTLKFSYFNEELNALNELEMQIWYSTDEGNTWTQTKSTQRDSSNNWIETNKLYRNAWYTLAPPCTPIINNLTQYISLDSFFYFKREKLNTTGVYIDSLYSVIGCDSIVTLNLFMKPMTTLATKDTIIRGANFFVFKGKTYTSSQLIYDTIRGATSDVIVVYNMIINIPMFNHIDIVECNTFYNWRGIKLTKNGTYRDTVYQPYTDTIYQINLVLKDLDYSVSYINGAFVSNCTTCTAFQWYVCMPDGSKSKVINATNRSFRTTSEGDYSLEINGVDGCTGFTPCVNRHSLAVGTISEMNIVAYPNPVENYLNISLDKQYATLKAVLIDNNGRIVYNNTLVNVNDFTIDFSNIASGYYILNLTDANETTSSIKIVKK